MSVRYAHILTKMALGPLGGALVIIGLLGGCGQKDPTQPLTGTIFVSSDTTGAAIFLDGEDTHQVTPDTLRGIAIGSHVIRVHLEGFVSSPESLVVQVSSGQVFEAFFAMNQVAGSRRVVLLEHFTWVYCQPCPATNEIINGLLEELGPEKVVGIEYHPFSPDPFYDAATSENNRRKEYYGVSSVPALFVDGMVISEEDTSRLREILTENVQTKLDESPPVAVVVTDTVVGQSWAGTARLIGLTDVVVSDLRGFFVVLEREVHYDQPPGSNGEKDFYYVMRKILPEAYGENLNIGAGDTVTVQEECDLHPEVNPTQVYAIYFLQDYLSKEVLQAGTSLPAEASRLWFMGNLR